MLTPAGAGQRAWLYSYDHDPLAITLSITMPDACVNINAASSLVTGTDPICGTCDIQATVRVQRRINIDCFAWGVVVPARENLRFNF